MRLTGQYEKEYFNTPAMRTDEGRLHPLITYFLMSLTNNGALLVFMYMLFDGFSIVGVLATLFLILSSALLYLSS